jgi:hypothetical protein
VARDLAEKIEIVRDVRPAADGVEHLEPGAGHAWKRLTLERQLSAARPAPAPSDLRVGAAGTFDDGVSVNPRYDWRNLPGTVPASYAEAFRRNWRDWRQAGGVAQGDGVAREELDVWGRFA